jgi:hypothetical protein
MVCDEARRVVGVGYDDWPALKPETLARKIGPGPLLETGELRESIGWQSEGLEGQVGSNNDKAVWQELGTSRIPPRSFLAGAAQHMEDNIHKMAARAVMSVLGGGGCTPQMAELLHILKHVGHELKESAKDILGTNEDENGRRR